MSGESNFAPDELPRLARALPLPWSAYVRRLSVKNQNARSFCEEVLAQELSKTQCELDTHRRRSDGKAEQD